MADPSGLEPLLTVPWVAQHLGVQEETVRRMLRSGELQGFRLSRKAGWRIRLSDYAAFIKEFTTREGEA